MAEITKIEVSVVESPQVKVVNGTGRVVGEAYIRGVSAATNDTLNLATYYPKIQGILGPVAQTYDEATIATARPLNTWSGTTITFASHTGSGRYWGRWNVYY